MGESKAPEIPVDPNLGADKNQAQNDLIRALQKQTQGDMASLMARYGTQLAMAGTTISPMTGAAVAPTVKVG